MGLALIYTKVSDYQGKFFLSLPCLVPEIPRSRSHLQSYYLSCLAPGYGVTSQLRGCHDVALQRTGLSEVSRSCLGAGEKLPCPGPGLQLKTQLYLISGVAAPASLVFVC